uniref:Uncharacterized protein n=1 Tax=Octactis speculum TaxID=3111310 RepID=A0A6U3TCL5_9STRA
MRIILFTLQPTHFHVRLYPKICSLIARPHPCHVRVFVSHLKAPLKHRITYHLLKFFFRNHATSIVNLELTATKIDLPPTQVLQTSRFRQAFILRTCTCILISSSQT